jgi:hypothetical protein
MDRAPTTGQLLDVWEQGRFQTPAQRAFSLLALAVPAVSSEQLASYGIGQRDRELLDLRERIFGPRLTGAAQCPACGQEMELDFFVAAVRAQTAAGTEPLRAMQIGDYDLRFRLPTCGDLAALAANENANGQKSILLQRCVAEARHNGESIAVSLLPEDTTVTLSSRMAELDPQGDTRLALTCPNCAHHWESPLDIASYLWNEIHAWAVRSLREVHTLARAYGWREADILAMSSWRRQAYLELIQQ